MGKALFTDGEGPIVSEDLAADATQRVVPGLFPVISLYDDYLAEIGREGYQAGDTLALVVPFFLAHGLTDENIAEEARDAKVCLGVKEYITGLKKDGWEVRIISTAHSQMWELIGEYLKIPMEHIACTRLDLASLHERFGSREFINVVRAAGQSILSLVPLGKQAAEEVDRGRSVVKVFEDPKFKPLREGLDGFYWQQLPDMRFKVLEETRVMGGRRKIEAAQRFARELGISLADVPYVGDSITDDALHAYLSDKGGLPIAVNGNRYALRNARVAVATEDMRDLRPILDAWSKAGFEEVQRCVENSQISGVRVKERGPIGEVMRERHYHLIDPNNQEEFARILAIHKEFRVRVRGAATARLG